MSTQEILARQNGAAVGDLAGNYMKVRIDRIAPEGEGIGRPEGSQKVVFVPHGLPGEFVDAAPVEEKSQYFRARLNAIIESSQARIEPPCSYHFKPGVREFCGGCDWQHAKYEEQLKLKRDVVLDCVHRIAKLQAPVLETLASPSPWRYRNKVQVPFQPAEVPHRTPLHPGERVGVRGVVSGFYVPGSHRVIEFDDCLVQPELSVAILKTVREMVRKFGWRAYDENRGGGWLRHLYLRTNVAPSETASALGNDIRGQLSPKDVFGGEDSCPRKMSSGADQAVVTFVTRTPAFPNEREMIGEMTRRHPEIVGIWQNVQEAKTSVILGRSWRKVWGADRMTEKIGDLVLKFSPGAFLQVNTPAAEILYRTVEEFLFEGGFRPSLALDLYSGIGVIAFWIARKVGRVIGIEESREAVADAYENARKMGARNVAFVQGKTEIAMRRMKGLDSPRPWAAVLDPPRAGCESAVLKFLSEKHFERIIYVSCNPATFARDARRLVDSGYILKKIQPVDLFPQTSHVELVAQLTAVGKVGNNLPTGSN